MVGWSSRPGLAVVVVASLVISSLGIVAAVSLANGNGSSGLRPAAPASSASPSGSKIASSTSAGGLAHARAVENGLRAQGISPTTVHLPNFAGEVTHAVHQIAPSYTQAPAPMGVTDLGLRNVSGVLVPYELNTTSVAGSVNITNLQSIYVDGDGPDTYGIQLNSVVNGVTIFGNSSYEFWSQNYIGYTVSTHQLTFGDEVWNFSSPSGLFPQNSIYNFSVNGTFADFPFLYQGYGPTYTIAYPFALTLYLNTSTLGDRPALYFNYTLSNATFRQSASYDYLVFNSTVGTPSQAAPVPYYQADGYGYDPIGLINDMEIDILGNDDGDMTSFTAADATVSLDYWNASAGAMENVPSAFNAGQETGENAVGLLVYSSGGTNPFAIVHSGPGFVGGLWNYSAQNGAVADTVTVHPVGEYSFLFINVGSTENASRAQWVPTSTTGTTTFYLPMGGTYFLDYMLSDYDPATQVVVATASVVLPPVHLTYDPTVGIYTPLFAFNNAELASISSAGAGTVGNPYVLINNQYSSLAPQFGGWNDYEFPEFPGLLLVGTNAYVDVTPPSFEINLPAWDFSAPYVAALGLPATNNLQLQFYDASNVELVRAGGILGWMTSFQAGFPESSVMFWNCTGSVVLSNTFDDQGNSLLFYGGTSNLVWGNTFVSTPVVAANPLSVDGAGGWDTGINETESGDLIYNNQFEVGIPAITITYDPFPCDQYGYCYPVAYTDTWNVSEQPATNYTNVDGWNLTGSIIGTSYQGGNYWSNYGTGSNPFGVLPYNNSGALTVGGDYVPLVPFSLYEVTFQETALPRGTPWTVTLNGATAGSNATTLNISSPNGTFALSVAGFGSWQPLFPPTNVTVLGAPMTVSITFVQWTSLIGEEDYLGSGAVWSVSVTGGPLGSAAISGNATLPSPAAPYGFGPPYWIFLTVPVGGPYVANAFAAGYVNTNGPYRNLTIPYEPPSSAFGIVFGFAPLPGTLNLSVTPSNAAVWVDGQQVTLSSGAASLSVAPGIASLEALEIGYRPFFTNITVASNTTTFYNITMKPYVPGTLSLTVYPAAATVWVDGVEVSLVAGDYSASFSAGIHSIEVTAADYYPYYNNVTVVSNQTTAVPISLTAISSSSSGTWGISTAGWAIIAGLAILAAALLVGMIYFARRGRQGGGPPKTPPAQPWQESPPAQPWQETPPPPQ